MARNTSGQQFSFSESQRQSKALKVNFVIIYFIKVFFFVCFFVLSSELTIQTKPFSVFAAPFFRFSKAGDLVSLSNINGELVKQLLKQFQILFFMSEQITLMIYAVKIQLACSANYVKSCYTCKVVFMLPDINLLDFCHNIIICLVDKIYV